jgi:hypothetical protein
MHDQHRAMAAYKDYCAENWDDRDRDFIEHDEVIDLLQSIERHQHALREAYRTMQRWLDGSEEFALA